MRVNVTHLRLRPSNSPLCDLSSIFPDLSRDFKPLDLTSEGMARSTAVSRVLLCRSTEIPSTSARIVRSQCD